MFFLQKFHRRIPVKSPSPLSSAVELSAKATDTDGAQSTVTCHIAMCLEILRVTQQISKWIIKIVFLYKWFNSLNSLTFPSFFLYMVCVFSTFRAVITLEKSSPSAMWHRDRGWVWLRMPRKIPKMVCQFLATTSTIYINLLCGVNCCKNKTCDLNRQTDLFWKITSSFARNCTRGWHTMENHNFQWVNPL